MLPKIYSFWRLETCVREGKQRLVSFGNIQEVDEQILKIPYTSRYKFSTLSDVPMFRTVWNVGEGVILQGKAEKRLEHDVVFGIQAITNVSDMTFMHLFSIMHEHFGCMVMDEARQKFLTFKEFKQRVSSEES